MTRRLFILVVNWCKFWNVIAVILQILLWAIIHSLLRLCCLNSSVEETTVIWLLLLLLLLLLILLQPLIFIFHLFLLNIWCCSSSCRTWRDKFRWFVVTAVDIIVLNERLIRVYLIRWCLRILESSRILRELILEALFYIWTLL